MTLPAGFLDRPFAHRALHGSGRPENSLAAIQAAIEGGWAIELDVQLTTDAENWIQEIRIQQQTIENSNHVHVKIFH